MLFCTMIVESPQQLFVFQWIHEVNFISLARPPSRPARGGGLRDVLLLLVIVILVVTCSHARADFCFFVFSGLRSIPQESFKKLRGVSPWDTLDATQRISGASNWKLLAIQFREHRIRDVQRSEYELRINRSRRHFQFKIFGDSERRN